jgi:hypothetical protein
MLDSFNPSLPWHTSTKRVCPGIVFSSKESWAHPLPPDFLALSTELIQMTLIVLGGGCCCIIVIYVIPTVRDSARIKHKLMGFMVYF